DDAAVAGLLRHADRVERLGERADLVQLNEDRVGVAALDAALQALDVRDEEIVADQLHPLAELLGDELPRVPIVFGAAVLDRDERILRRELLVDPDELRPAHLLLVERVLLRRLVEELARGAVERNVEVLARGVAGALDRGDERLDRSLVRLEARSEAS